MVSTRLPLFIMYIIRDLMSRVIACRAATHSLPQMVPTSSNRIDDFKRNQPRILAALEPFYEAGSCQEEIRDLIGSPFYSSFHS